MKTTVTWPIFHWRRCISKTRAAHYCCTSKPATLSETTEQRSVLLPGLYNLYVRIQERIRQRKSETRQKQKQADQSSNSIKRVCIARCRKCTCCHCLPLNHRRLARLRTNTLPVSVHSLPVISATLQPHKASHWPLSTARWISPAYFNVFPLRRSSQKKPFKSEDLSYAL